MYDAHFRTHSAERRRRGRKWKVNEERYGVGGFGKWSNASLFFFFQRRRSNIAEIPHAARDRKNEKKVFSPIPTLPFSLNCAAPLSFFFTEVEPLSSAFFLLPSSAGNKSIRGGRGRETRGDVRIERDSLL